uniref:SCP domain-containing protein n=1 Tax=Mesocestoides corti TaxID=53468 RepID=A0A5K3FDJ9_MESCO
MRKLLYLLMLPWNVLAETPSKEERKTIVECHTKLREEVKPPASNMQLIRYSDEMEKLAQVIFAQCDDGDPEFEQKFPNVGVLELNLRSTKPKYEDLCLVDSGTYFYKNDTCKGSCQNYLRMIWASTTEVGCFLGVCIKRGYYNRRDNLLLCAYRPTVRSLRSLPYEKGRSCSKCPQGYKCHRKQCSKESFVVKQLDSPQCIQHLTA